MPPPTATQQFKIQGLDCAEEVAVLKREVGPLVGEARLAFDILNARMIVTAGPGEVAGETIINAVARTGMRAELWREDQVGDKGLGWWARRGRTLLTAASGAAALVSVAFHVAAGWGDHPGVAAQAGYVAAILAGLWLVLPKAWIALKRLRPDMNLLMVVAVAGAVVIGEWAEAATVAFLFALSLELEAWSVGRVRRAVTALLDLAPPTARVVADGQPDREVSVKEVAVGAVLVVRPGERIPLDGKVSKGNGHVNQAPITGESVPAPKEPGDDVFAGTVNGEGVLEVAVTRAANDTTLARIIRMVGESQSRRAASERWVDGFAAIYTPAVMALAVAVALVPPFVFAGGWWEWVYRALVLLVIACPCALVISTPVSIVAALTAAARNGVLVKGGMFIELPATLKAVAVDKTGTLTEGRPVVVEVVPLNGHDEGELLERAAGLEARSEHPLARAVIEYAASKGVAVTTAEDLRAVPGKGAVGRWQGREFWLGSPRYLAERGQETDDVLGRVAAMTAAGRSVVVVGNEKHVCGLIALADAVRPAARDAIRDLKELGVVRVVMLTGDNEATARAVGKEAGVDDVRAGLLPEEKVAAVEALVAEFGSVAMVGDGVNDAPALARASLGIAMGAAGTDAAIETADVALMSDDLGKLPWLIRHSRRTMSVIRQNVAFSLAVKAVFVILTFAGYSSLWAAIAADTGASLVVIFNGLRLLGRTRELREGEVSTKQTY
ncbi:heavy metal translocating p-type atpase : Heavy metal translocating P-type ATPase OS=Rhodopirellula europaea SH398 GN=RESH_06308 PE=3 SV=1: E1-E2_ATPase: Hydrolase [Gemmataceae bacterium]|nr:heavy metal translocating p-type atpase : Heavy metal translocating P-type ATPase OS=Rhodopirellula europaea SH398 GN=RESH_06308 PE=3 SV=1: E1-E2_ATPase: Hydrolase [Gemmataceae bacterium]VTU01666.1 heavy metal translocating p-type atpase : Heavy metal translocating P-type ATPase OS=Rhodopirellula europaea SH398 GN=RESH_06308 PE=3 SV=1: E1-E2_ATPase: Hydrolase [Gemmataceae bacterium]